MALNKEDLAEAIRDGMNRSRDDLTKEILHALYVIVGALLVIVFLIFLWNDFHVNKPNDEALAPVQSCFPFKNLDCKIYEEHGYYNCEGKIYPVSVFIETSDSNISKISMSNESCIDVSNQIPLTTNSICGYSESESWFNQYKENYDGSFKLKMECN
jgi:hypothetical protein